MCFMFKYIYIQVLVSWQERVIRTESVFAKQDLLWSLITLVAAKEKKFDATEPTSVSFLRSKTPKPQISLNTKNKNKKYPFKDICDYKLISP